jgi:hypothetical protein
MRIKTTLFGREIEATTSELKQLAVDEVLQVGYLKAIGQLDILNRNFKRERTK